MAAVIGDVLIHVVVGEDLAIQRDRCGKQELEMVLGGDVAIFHVVPLDTGTVGSRELGSCAVHHVKEGVDRLTSNDSIILRVNLKQIKGRGLPSRGGHDCGNNTRWWWYEVKR